MKLLIRSDREAVCNVVCGYLEIKRAAIMSRDKTYAVCTARNVIFYLLSVLTGASETNIGRAFDRTPSGVRYGIHCVLDLVSIDAKFSETVTMLEGRCKLILEGVK